METLRSFVAAFLKEGTYHSKPDTLSDSYELRRFKLRRASRIDGGPTDVNLDWPETDFYEYYWAHQMYGTTASHVVTWLCRTLCRGLRIIRLAPAAYIRLRRLAILAWILVTFVALGTIGAAAWFSQTAPVKGGVLFLALLGALKLLPKWVLAAVALDFAGDAARYFDVNPKNVARRYDILRGGIGLLRKLHEERDEQGDEVMYRYGRIVLVGHSLGSVIAYDMLRHYWAEVNGRIPIDESDVIEVESYCGRNSRPPFPDAKPFGQAPRFWQAQRDLWTLIRNRVPSGEKLHADELWRQHLLDAKQRRHDLSDVVDYGAAAAKCPPNWQPARWLISDLVTLGCPLAHAPVLLARGTGDLKSKIRLRELPTCPPDRSRHLNRGHFVVRLSAELESMSDYCILHHGAPFALTRWTNFWYPNDPVGGPLRPAFGSGIDDVCLPNASKWPVVSHILYWRPGQSAEWGRLKDILVGTKGHLFCPRPQVRSVEPGSTRSAAAH
jgi:pimeloyl-ACP methyl ester carboxylesterase